MWHGKCSVIVAMHVDSAFRKLSLPSTNTSATCGNDVCPDIQRRAGGWTQQQRCLWCVVLLLILIAPAWAQIRLPAEDLDPPPFDGQSGNYLLGDWGGERTALAEKGIKFDFFYIADLQANPSGGLQQSQAGWERIRGTVDINFDHILQWQGLSFHATGLWQVGANLGAKIGTIANPSDLVSAHTTRLDSWWLEQYFVKNKFRIRAGQLAGFDFYGNQDYGGSWLMEPLGYAFGNLFGATYESFNPAGTPGVEVRFAPTRNFYVKSAVMAGNRDQYHQDLTGFGFKILNTPDFLFESGYLVHPQSDGSGAKSGSSAGKSYPGIYKFGAAYNAGKFSNSAEIRSNGNYLLYAMASQAVFRSDPGSNRGLDATFGFDWSPGDVTRQNVQITAGARFNAPFAGREKDRIACGFVYSKISDPYRQFGELLGAAPLGSEKAFELNYSLQVTPYFLLQPTFQYYVDVGANPALPNAPVLGFRTKVTF